MFWVIVSAISYSRPCRRARRAVPFEAHRRHPAWPGFTDNWVRRDAAAVGHSCTRARRAAAKGRLEVPPPMLLWRATTSHSLSAGFQETGQSTSLSVAASMKHDLLLHCQRVEFDLVVPMSFLESLIIYVYVGSQFLRPSRSVLVDPPPCEACAAVRSVPPLPGVA